MRARPHFDFVTREQVAPGPDSFDISPRRAKVWVGSLPVANSGETGRLLFAALSEVNGLRFDVGERFKFLELMRTPVSLLSGILERHYMGKPFPLPARDRQVAELSREFQGLMAEGYKILLKDMGRRPVLPLGVRRRVFATAVHRAIRHLSRMLLKSYQLYSPYPDNVWRDLHKLYRLAAWHRIQDWRVVDEQSKLEPETSVGDAYKQILLLAISSPYRLRQGDVGRVYAALERWAPCCQKTEKSSTRIGRYSKSLGEKLAMNLNGSGLDIPHKKLSDREYQVMCYIASGKRVPKVHPDNQFLIRE